MNFNKIFRPRLLSRSVVLTFLAIFPIFFAVTAQANTDITVMQGNFETSKMSANPEISTSTINKYITTTGNIRNDHASAKLDQNIIFSMILVIFLGFLTLFSAVGYHRSSAMQKVFRLFQFQR